MSVRSLVNYRWSNFKIATEGLGTGGEVSEMTGMVAALEATAVREQTQP